MTGSVLIVGGGIAGRAAARALARHGLGCTVIEHRESLGRGMGVNLPGNAVRALAELDVPDEALASGVPATGREYRNSRGRCSPPWTTTSASGAMWGDLSVCATATCSTPSHSPRRPHSSTRRPWPFDRRRMAADVDW